MIINRNQFGYHIDTYFYCKYAVTDFDITYIGFDAGSPKVKVDQVRVIYVSRKGDFLVRYFRLIWTFAFECRNDYDIIFIKYFIGCSILRVLNCSKLFVLDIRTGSVVENSIKRCFNDFVMKLESRFFENISIISQSLATKLKLPKEKVHILPLGAKPRNIPFKKFDSLRLLYVGTLNGRRIDDTIMGFYKFYTEINKHNEDNIEMTYDIIGDGHGGELNKLRDLVSDLGLEAVVFIHGFIHQDKLDGYYQKCNVGVSYVPINDIYDCQPSTKTFEFILAGMPVIATCTTENSRVVNYVNGILIKDSPESFYEGLVSFMHVKNKWDSFEVKKTCLGFAWDNIISNNLIRYLQKIYL
ncbi:MAG: glycosyltransferase [Bacteroidales bacterium]|nr:glycosyltransferase [Bacteroidales bacterium]